MSLRKANSVTTSSPSRERSRRRNDEKRQARQEVKNLNREEPVEQQDEQEERAFRLCHVVSGASWRRKCALVLLRQKKPQL